MRDEADLERVKIVEPRVFSDGRGYFMETHNRDHFAAAGIDCSLMADLVASGYRQELTAH